MCSVLIAEGVHWRIPLLIVQKLVVQKIHLLLVPEVANCKKPLVTRCKTPLLIDAKNNSC